MEFDSDLAFSVLGVVGILAGVGIVGILISRVIDHFSNKIENSEIAEPVLGEMSALNFADNGEVNKVDLDEGIQAAISKASRRGVEIRCRKSSISKENRKKIKMLTEKGHSVLGISKELGIPRTTLRRFLGKIK